MKVTVIQLEPRDTTASVCARIKASQSRRVLLVWPRRGELLTTALELTLVYRCCQQNGVQLALVTSHPQVIFSAAHVGIPGFSSVSAAQHAAWGRPRKNRPLLHQHKRKQIQLLRRQVHKLAPVSAGRRTRLVVLAFVALFVLGLGFFLLPSARITLPLQRHDQSLTLSVRASPAFSSYNILGNLPARMVTMVEEGQAEAQSSALAAIPSQPAQGGILLTNLTDQAITVPAGTVVLTLGTGSIRFQTLQEVIVPASGEAAAQVSIQAILPGTSGNVDAGAIRAMEGPLGASLGVENPLPTSGGTDTQVRVPSELDYEALRASLLDSLGQTALQEMTLNLPEGQRLLPGTLTVEKVLEETRLPEAGQPSDSLILRLQVEFSALAISEEDLLQLVQTGLDASLPVDYQAVPGTLMTNDLGSVGYADGVALWEVFAVRSIRPQVSPSSLVYAVAGQTPARARALLRQMVPLQGDPQIRLLPGFWPRLPYLTFRIRVEVQ